MNDNLLAELRERIKADKEAASVDDGREDQWMPGIALTDEEHFSAVMNDPTAWTSSKGPNPEGMI